MKIPALLFSSDLWFIDRASYAQFCARVLAASDQLDRQPMPTPGGISADQVTAILSLMHRQRPAASLERETGIAHIHVFGPLARNLAPIARATGSTDYDQIHEDYAAARAAGARGIMLHVESPGGTVSGAPEAAALIAAREVPTVVHTTMAGSAGYYLAAGAHQIIASPSAITGSVGVVLPRQDMSELLEKLGVETDTIVNTGADLKGADMQGELTPEQRAHMQDMADAMGQAFQRHVASYRRIEPEVYRGGAYYGQRALDLNLIDGFGDAAFARQRLLALMGS